MKNINNNKLIIRFLGYLVSKNNDSFKDENGIWRTCIMLEEDRDISMRCVEKIQDCYDIQITGSSFLIGSYMAAGMINWHVDIDNSDLDYSFLEMIYRGVLRFVIWYNNPSKGLLLI